MSISRRHFIQRAAAGSAATLLIIGRAKAAPACKLLDTRIISPQLQYYCGWSTVAQRKNGDLWVTWSGGREEHVCPFGQVHSMISTDKGASWTWPRVLLDSATDDRDSGVLETGKGTLLVSTFTSLAYEPLLASAEKKGKWPAERLQSWHAAQNRLNQEGRTKELGEWILRSTDSGLSWSSQIPSLTNSPHGPVLLGDGRLIYPGKQLWTKDQKIGVSESKDDGLTWQWLCDLPVRKGDTVKNYHELHAVEAANGTIIVQIRNHNEASKGETLQCESSDGGKTWSEPHSIGVWGLPSHLLKLRDGRLLMSYGHRRAPLGNQARISEDHGKTWSEPLMISQDGTSGDLGYPSTVELADGTLLTIWYESVKDHPKAVLRQATWQLV